MSLYAGCVPGTGTRTDRDLSPSPDLSFNFDQGAARVVHVRDQHFVPAQITVRVGETVRFVFDAAGHNATTVTSAGDMDPVWYPDRRGCSAGDCTRSASALGDSWDYVFPYAAQWPVVCGLHALPGSPMPAPEERVWVEVTP